MSDFLKKIDSSWTLFLDRDGVINKRLVDDYIKEIHEFEFLPGVKESIATLSAVFGKIIVITNQQGVGKKLMTEDKLKKIHNMMISEIKQAGGNINAVYYCIDLKETPDNCRKPSPGMFLQAKMDFPDIEAEKSIMVGDSQSDVEFGKNAGMFTVFLGKQNTLANVCFTSLKEFAEAIHKQ